VQCLREETETDILTALSEKALKSFLEDEPDIYYHNDIKEPFKPKAAVKKRKRPIN
jgi:hypothetical protein